MSQLFKNWLFKNRNQLFQQTFWFLPKGLLFVFLIYSITSKAQYNLVPNSSFEDTIACPSGSQIYNLYNWINPTGGSPDVYNTCINRVPSNPLGFQYAKEGSCYIGIYTYALSVANVREYIQVQLIDTLITGNQYCISFYINLADSSRYATDEFGAYLSNTQISSTNYNPLPCVPQVKNTSGNLLNNKNSWIEISGIYTALGGEKYLTIGNFNNDSTTDTLYSGPNYSVSYSFAYYYVDAISVVGLGLTANAGNDTSVTIGDSVLIGSNTNSFGCNWYDSIGNFIGNNPSVFVSPTSTTYYVVEQNLCGTITYDTVNVTVNPVGINETEKAKFSCKIFPNPNTGEFNVELNTSENNIYKLNVMDMQYRILYSEKTYSNSFKLNLDLESGAYLLHITNVKTNETVVQKLVIQK